MMYRYLALVFALCSLASASPLWTPLSFPNPNTSPGACGRPGVTRSSLCDPDGLLNSKEKDVTEGILTLIAEAAAPYPKSPCSSNGEGFQVAVAIMNRMDLAGSSPADTASSFARSLHNSWGVGHGPQCNDGALFLLSVQDRQMFISTGDVSGERLSDQTCDLIFEQLKPLLRNSAYDEAVQKAVVLVGQSLAGVPVSPGKSGTNYFEWMIIPGFFCFVVVFAVFNHRMMTTRNRDFKSCKSRLEEVKRLSEALQQANTQSYNPSTCPICFEEFAPTLPTEMTPLDKGKEIPEPSAPPLETDASDKEPLLGSSSPISSPTAAQSTKHVVNNVNKINQPSKKPLILPCQHQFCETCIEAWVKQSKASCPICRNPLNGRPEAPPPPPGSGARPGDPQYYHHHYHHPHIAWRRARHQEELVYRMQQLRQRYPTYVTESMARRARDDITEGRQVDPSVFTDLQLNDPATRKALESSGSRGSSISFGGGRSSGGRGSSW